MRDRDDKNIYETTDERFKKKNSNAADVFREPRKARMTAFHSVSPRY